MVKRRPAAQPWGARDAYPTPNLAQEQQVDRYALRGDVTAVDVLVVATRYSGQRVAHFSMEQWTEVDTVARRVYRVDTSDGSLHEHTFHQHLNQTNRRGRRRELEDVRTVDDGGWTQLAATWDRHLEDCWARWEIRKQRWARS